jgi:hypothetical protein
VVVSCGKIISSGSEHFPTEASSVVEAVEAEEEMYSTSARFNSLKS